MLFLISLASAGTWPICGATSTTATTNGGWTVVEIRESDGSESSDQGVWSSETSLSRSYGGMKQDNACDSEDGMGGALMRWTSELLSVDALPGQGQAVNASCDVTVSARGQSDASARAILSQMEMKGMARGDAVSDADAENSGTISVDSGGGGQFAGEWAWGVPGAHAAKVRGVIRVGVQAAYAGATLDIPGWAQIDAWDGDVEGWVREGSTWIHVKGKAPMEIAFGAVVAGRGQVCATGLATAGSRSENGGGAIGAAAIEFSMEPIKSIDEIDARPTGGPEFSPCSCYE